MLFRSPIMQLHKLLSLACPRDTDASLAPYAPSGILDFLKVSLEYIPPLHTKISRLDSLSNITTAPPHLSNYSSSTQTDGENPIRCRERPQAS
jgi:hypothetical protein